MKKVLVLCETVLSHVVAMNTYKRRKPYRNGALRWRNDDGAAVRYPITG